MLCCLCVLYKGCFEFQGLGWGGRAWRRGKGFFWGLFCCFFLGCQWTWDTDQVPKWELLPMCCIWRCTSHVGGSAAACWKSICYQVLLWVQPCSCARHGPKKVGVGTGCHLEKQALFHCLPLWHSCVCSWISGKACEMFLFLGSFAEWYFFCSALCSSLCMSVSSLCSWMNLVHWQFGQAAFQDALSTSSVLEMCTLPAGCLLYLSLVKWTEQRNERNL